MKSVELDLRKKADKNTSLKKINKKVESKNLEFKTKLEQSNNKKRNLKKIFLLANFFMLLFVVGVGYIIYYFVYAPLNNINNSVNKILETNSLILEDFSKKDLRNIDLYVDNINTEISYIDSQIARYDFLKNYGATQGYYNNMVIIQDILQKSQAISKKVIPGLKNTLETSGFIVSEQKTVENNEDEAESALNLVLQELPLYIDLYEDVEPDIYEIFNDIKKLDPNYLPSYGNFNPDEDWSKVMSFIEEYPELSQKTKSFLENVPSLLGTDQKTAYLLILQNESEMRASGGLITAFGVVEIENGEVAESGINLQDSWNLQYYLWGLGLQMPLNNIYGQAYLMNLGCGATEARAQDVAQYPDLYKTMTDFGLYYDLANYYGPEEFPSYDHYLIVNHHFTKEMIKLVEPIEVEVNGELTTVTSENLFDVVKEETDDSSRAFDRERKSILGEIAEIAKEKFLELSVKDLPLITKTVISLVQGKDIAIASKDDNIQNYLDEYGLSGRIAYDFEGDYFHLNEAQNCALKMNRWIRNTVEHKIYIDAESGNIEHEATIKWYQPKIWEESLAKQYDRTLRFRYRAWVRIFMPPGSDILENDGYWASVPYYYWPKEYYDSFMNKFVSDNVVSFDHRRLSDIDPVEKKTMTMKYALPQELNYSDKGGYKLLLQKHPGKSWEDGTFEKHLFEFYFEDEVYKVEVDLNRDKVLEFKDGIITVSNYDTSLDWIVGLIDSLPLDKLKNE